MSVPAKQTLRFDYNLSKERGACRWCSQMTFRQFSYFFLQWLWRLHYRHNSRFATYGSVDRGLHITVRSTAKQWSIGHKVRRTVRRAAYCTIKAAALPAGIANDTNPHKHVGLGEKQHALEASYRRWCSFNVPIIGKRLFIIDLLILRI